MKVTPIIIDRNVKETCVCFTGLCRREAMPEKVVIRLRPAHKRHHLIEYPGELKEDGTVCFRWGELMWGLEPGRYVGDLFDGGDRVGFIQFQVNPQHWQAGWVPEVVCPPKDLPDCDPCP